MATSGTTELTLMVLKLKREELDCYSGYTGIVCEDNFCCIGKICFSQNLPYNEQSYNHPERHRKTVL
ncbi:Interferon-Induced Protein With Tetratricopeptide Repeats 2 [Manis pentadactyla]|nr:Interferon-Induced Protein With Tetratricopeptide Repeats 2 [Manis pentadactyla]